MSRDRLQKLVTLGATDKHGDETKQGEWGLGFYTIFNPRLGTKRVTFTTRCEGRNVEAIFLVNSPTQRPDVSIRIIDQELPYSTKVEVEFDDASSPPCCLNEARRRLRYIPCKARINGGLLASVWQDAEESMAQFFENGPTEGFIEPTSRLYVSQVTVLCKYEYILKLGLGRWLANRKYRGDLTDYVHNEAPYLPHRNIIVNCNRLSLVISRDGYYLNASHRQMFDTVRKALLDELEKALDNTQQDQLVLANQFIFRERLKKILDPSNKQPMPQNKTNKIAACLAVAKVYRLANQENPVSLLDIYGKLQSGAPLFYSSQEKNLNWLGGRFKHDFIVLPAPVLMGGGASHFYDTLFGEIFGDVVDLDIIEHDHQKIVTLVSQGIVDPSALDAPETFIVQPRSLSGLEQQTLQCIDAVLGHPAVQDTIRHHLHIPFREIKTAFFNVDEEGATIATGLFDQDGTALEPHQYTNLELEPELDLNQNTRPVPRHNPDIFLGLHGDHPFIQKMVETHDPYKAYYALSFLAHELASCQKMLRPGTPFYHRVKEGLAADMRRALMEHLLAVNTGQGDAGPVGHSLKTYENMGDPVNRPRILIQGSETS